MTHDRDLDRVLDRWMDDGPTIVADRVIATAMTDVHTTRQRGARLAPLKELFMTMKPAATLVAVTLIAALGIAAYQLIWSGGQIGNPSEPRIIAASELPDIVMNADDAPSGMNLDGIYTDRNEVLLRPIISVEGPDATLYTQQPGFIAGRFTEFSDEQAGVLSWVALFATADDAQRALGLYAEEVESAEGYGLTSRVDASLGDEGAFYSDGDDPEFNAQVYLWRTGNLVLAAATYGDFDPGELGQLAEGMDDRAH
jgi:hypothetical protein